MPLAYLSLGSNLGNREENLWEAIKLLARSTGEIIQKSAVYEYKPWGFDSENLFLNMAVGLKSNLEPFDLLRAIKEIETRMGREPATDGYCDRPVDIDIIFYDDLILETDGLIIPHPLMHKRKFVLEPLAEIAPDKEHMHIGKTVKELYGSLK